MFLTMSERTIGGDPTHTFVTVEGTGKLKPIANITYKGTRHFGPSREDRVTRFIIEKTLQPHEQHKLAEIFGESHDHSKAEKAQKAMYAKFVEKFEEYFEKLLKGETIPPSNEASAQPVYFYQESVEHSSAVGGELFQNSLKKKAGNLELPQISVYAGVDTKLCEITCEKQDGEKIIKATQLTIQALSQAASLDINDLFKGLRRGEPDGPNGMK